VQTGGNWLTINPVNDEDFGIVSCTVSNIAGQVTATAELQVIGCYLDQLSFLTVLLSLFPATNCGACGEHRLQ